MCVALVKNKDIDLPNKDVLKVCFKNNPDGAGFAYCRDGNIVINKGFFTFEGFYKALESANIKKHESALIHFRVATHGNIDKHTCHPFLITDNYEDMRKTNIVTSNGDVMIHNGMLNFELDEKEISDSMYLAKYLSKYNLFNETNAYMLNIALLNNNNKSKMNRVGVLRIDNTVEMYGFKEPWEEVEGCYFSNKSYQVGFSRTYSNYSSNYVTEAEKKEKLEYTEDEIQSKKISFCHNHSKGCCDELSVYAVHSDEKNYDEYCEKCIDDVIFFNCKYCGHSYYYDKMSSIDHICNDCFVNNSEFLMNSKCELCSDVAKHIVFHCEEDAAKNNLLLCDKCFSKTKPFKCSECQRWYPNSENCGIENMCVSCYASKKSYSVDECTYCKSKTNLLRTSYSTVCHKCFEDKKGKTCFVCDRKYIWGDDHIGNFDFCPTCAKKSSVNEIVLDNFKSFKLLNPTIRQNLAAMFNNCSDSDKINVLEVYKYNNYFDQMQSNANQAYDLMNKN